ncbi:MAG: DUF4362 domain-containing protein [Bacillota bacterium]|nr:DUF4362 domain-containing protein [Bacillota bacterium]
MKRYVGLLTFVFLVLLFGCSSDKYVSLPYSIKNAYKNNNVIDIYCGNKYYNLDKLESFISSVKNGEKEKIRIVSYNYDERLGKLLLDYPEHIYDLSFDGKRINIIIYNTMSSSENKLIKTDSKSFKAINKIESKNDTQYVIESNNDRIVILSAVKNGCIDDNVQKYIEEKLKEAD